MDISSSNTFSKPSTGINPVFMFFRLLFYFSPWLMMFFMWGSALMSGTPFVFLFYFLFLFLALLFRHLLWWMFRMTSNVECGKTVYFPFIFGNYKDYMSTFLFAFTIFYVFGPFFNWKQSGDTSILMCVFLIFYATYDLFMRAFLTDCRVYNRAILMTILGNIFIGGLLGSATQGLMNQMGLSKYMYYTSNVNRPTKKVFRCGKIKTK
jgi:hypothetical protein